MDYYKAKESLELVKACFYTFTPKKDKAFTILLKGLHHSYDPQDILSELQALNVEGLNFSKVTHFKTKKSINENIPLSMFVVQLDATSIIHNLQKINRLCHHVVTWEKLKNSDIIQCKRCQRLGHVASNCNMKYRCVKCNEPHEPGQCEITPNSITDKSKIFCVNCKHFGHPASYRGCPVLLDLKKRAAEKKEEFQEKRERKIMALNSYVKKNISFANMVKNKINSKSGDSFQINNSTNSKNKFPSGKEETDAAFQTNLNELFDEFKNQILGLLQKQQEQINSLTTLAENNNKKTNYVLNIIDSIYQQND